MQRFCKTAPVWKAPQSHSVIALSLLHPSRTLQGTLHDLSRGTPGLCGTLLPLKHTEGWDYLLCCNVDLDPVAAGHPKSHVEQILIFGDACRWHSLLLASWRRADILRATCTEDTQLHTQSLHKKNLSCNLCRQPAAQEGQRPVSPRRLRLHSWRN